MTGNSIDATRRITLHHDKWKNVREDQTFEKSNRVFPLEHIWVELNGAGGGAKSSKEQKQGGVLEAAFGDPPKVRWIQAFSVETLEPHSGSFSGRSGSESGQTLGVCPAVTRTLVCNSEFWL